jgi:hypothetical protein
MAHGFPMPRTLALLTLAMTALLVPSATAHYGAGTHTGSTSVLQDECAYRPLSGLLGAFNCVRVEGSFSTFTCSDTGTGTSRVRTCGGSTFTFTVTAYNWANPGSFSVTATGTSAYCGSPTDSDAAAWGGSLTSPSLPVSRTVTVSCGGFSYGWGQCAGHSASVAVDYSGDNAPADLWSGAGHWLECIPYP